MKFNRYEKIDFARFLNEMQELGWESDFDAFRQVAASRFSNELQSIGWESSRDASKQMDETDTMFERVVEQIQKMLDESRPKPE